MSATPAKAQVRNLRLNDAARIHLEEYCSGQPLVLVTGWACSTEVFERNIPAFAAGGYRVIAYDPRSQGRSQQTVSGNNYGQRGRDLAAVLRALDIRSACLLGWSLGVYDILSYVEQYGYDHVRCLALIDESPKIVKASEADWGEGNAEEIVGVIEAAGGDGYLDFFRSYIASGFEGDPPEDLLDRMRDTAAALPPQRAAALLADAAQRNYEPVSREAASEVPVLQLVRKDWAEHARRWISANQPLARIEVLGGHMMLVEHAEAFNTAVLSFLNDHCALPRSAAHARRPWASSLSFHHSRY